MFNIYCQRRGIFWDVLPTHLSLSKSHENIKGTFNLPECVLITTINYSCNSYSFSNEYRVRVFFSLFCRQIK